MQAYSAQFEFGCLRMTGTVHSSLEVSLTTAEAFDTLVNELALGLEKRGLRFEPGSGGSITQRGEQVGVVEEWIPGLRISLQWRPKNWERNTQSRILISLGPSNRGTVIKVESQDWGRVLQDDKGELLGWFAGEVVADLLQASAPARVGDWITDRHARAPSGERSRHIYRNPVYHWPNFMAILDTLSLKPVDNLLEVGCGGGAFLHEALKSGCRAAAVDHSADMIQVAIEQNRTEIEKGRLTIEKSEADDLPFPNNTFTCAVMTGVLGFLPDALSAFTEVNRVLRKDGRFVAFTSTKALLGTPAVSEPAASRLHFYEDRELERLARDAGFDEVRIEHPYFYEYAKKAGVPESDLELFKGTKGSQLMIAQKLG